MNKKIFQKNKNFSKKGGNLGMSDCEYIIEGQISHQIFLNEEKTKMNDKCLVVNQFKKKVRISLHNLRINIYKADVKRRDNLILTNDDLMCEDEFYDNYTFLENTVMVMNFKMTVKNDLLYEVLNSMSQHQRDIIYLSLCKDMSDKKIGEKLKMTRSNVQKIKQKMKIRIYDALKGDSENED